MLIRENFLTHLIFAGEDAEISDAESEVKKSRGKARCKSAGSSKKKRGSRRYVSEDEEEEDPLADAAYLPV
jgi:hypothetical protein